MGRPKQEETKEKRKDVYFTPTEWQELLNALPPGAKPGPFIYDATMRAIAETREAEETEAYDEIPVTGYIAGGAAICITPAADGLMVTPPFALPANSYALLLAGNSMESLNGNSIPDGSCVFLQGQAEAQPGATVHVEWEEAGDDRRYCTLKKYFPDHDKGQARFEPLNKAHKTIVKKFGEFTIKGAYIRHMTMKKESGRQS